MTKMTLGCGFSKVGLAEVAKSDNEVVVQSNASVRPRSERFEMKPLDAIMVLIWIANRMWGIDDLVKKKFSRAVLQVESRDCVDPAACLVACILKIAVQRVTQGYRTIWTALVRYRFSYVRGTVCLSFVQYHSES